jgi:aspartate/methionine/tyrosine aminotransferase
MRLRDVEPAIGRKTRAILLNSPSNPTGAVNDPAETRALVEMAAARGIWVISDECYDEVVFEGPSACAGTFAALDGGPVLSAFSFSKTYAMTGWRIGYLVAPAEVSGHVTRMQAAAVASASVVSQRAALAALDGPQAPCAEMVSAYARRRDLAMAVLDRAGLGYIRPQGALYLFVDIREAGIGSREFATALLRERAVCTTPGAAFGESGDGFVRVSLACSEADLKEGVKRLVAFTRERSGGRAG